MREKHEYYDFQRIRSWRDVMIKKQETVEITEMGAGSAVSHSKKRKVGDIVLHGSIPEKYGKLLFRMINRYSPDGILELGTSAGISALYLSLPKHSAKVVTIEGCPNVSALAKNTFNYFAIKNIELLNGDFLELLPDAIKKLPSLDFVFFDGNHRKEPTLAYFNQCLKHINNNTIFVFDDIHWSQGMEEVWQEIIANTSVTVSIDIFRLGIVFFRKESRKEHYIVRF